MDAGLRLIVDRRRAASLKAGGVGIRYTCLICGGQHYLFYEENYKWFVEAVDNTALANPYALA
jgi:hypothetical protein